MHVHAPRERRAAAEAGELAVVSIPWEGVEATIPPMADALAGKVVISVVNALRFGKSGAIAEQDLPGGSCAAPHPGARARGEGRRGLQQPPRRRPPGPAPPRRRRPGVRQEQGGPRGGHRADQGDPGHARPRRRPAGQRPHPRGDDGHHHQPQQALRRRGAASRSRASRTPRSARTRRPTPAVAESRIARTRVWPAGAGEIPLAGRGCQLAAR